MVCERDPASPNDPAEGRIALVRDGDWLTADGTTLGADDGVAIAAMMALVEDESIPHGPLELLMTVAEEVGLEGANALDGSLLTRLDADQPRQRGGRRPDRRVRRQHRHLDPGRRAARGVLAGRGHAVGRGRRRARRPLGRPRSRSAASNAIKVLGRVLREAHATVPFRLVSLDGGKSRNAIPRDAVAVCSVPRDQEGAFRAAVERRPPSCATPTRRPTPESP